MDRDRLLTFYREMLRIRIAEEKIAEVYPEQEMRCPTHLCIGQEATPVGVCQALEAQDYAFGNHRSHGHYLAKGGNLHSMMAELYGRDAGCASGKGGSMHLIDTSVGFMGAVPILGATVPLSVGAALASVLRSENRVCAAFCGDAATEEGVFYESVNYAAVRKLPVLFVCENNLYSTHTGLSDRRPSGVDIHEIMKGFGIVSEKGDGNNVEEVFQMASKAVKRARAGEGPTFLEFSTYRWLEHCGPYDDRQLGYRTGEEIEAWKNQCPIKQFEARNLNQAGITQADFDSLREEVEVEVEEALEFGKNAPYPEAAAIDEGVYAP